jgi:hypothetical protein
MQWKRDTRCDQIKKIKSGRVRSYVWGREEEHTGFWWVSLRKGDHLEDLSVDEKVILKWFLEKWDVGGMD